jgi:ATP-dependent RNA circularization protein (DNA/RNA ligase family)
MPDAERRKLLDVAEAALQRAWPVGERIDLIELYGVLAVVVAYLRIGEIEEAENA